MVRFGMRVDRGEVQIQEFADGPRPFRALYEHWERHQWSPFAIDFSTDAASFAALDERTRDGLVLVFAHRFHAEFNVAALLAPFLIAAPDYEVQLLLATQVADEHRHIESVLRVYSDVFAVEGGIAAVKALADAQLDQVAAALYAALDDVVRALEASRDEDSFLKAVVAYHLIGEGSIGRANQNFVAAQFDRVGSFPGLREAQRLAVRDEVRHIGIGVSYARRRLTRDGARAGALIKEIVEGFQALGDSLLEHAAPGLLDDFVGAYGAEPATLWAEVLHQLRVRLRSIGFSMWDARAGSPCDHGVRSSDELWTQRGFEGRD
jgi:ribonucleotide reductase beta subunit family protein with ferritin-like domain